MLIKALCDYYDALASDGKVLPDGYSKVNVHYLVCLTPDGKIDDIISCQRCVQIPAAKGKTKEKYVPREVVMPKRTEKSGIESNIVEHRPLYIFGLNFDKEHNSLTPDDKTDKAKKSNIAFKERNLSFLEGLDSPVVNAYRNFIANWDPESEVENKCLLRLGKDYQNSSFAFCLSGFPDLPLHEDKTLNEKWLLECSTSTSESDNDVIAQCAVTGEKEPIARIHNKIKGVYGGLATGSVLIGFKNSSGCSYVNEQSYNSNISETAMKKYTDALNYLLGDKRHKKLIDDITVVYWATGGEKNESCSDFFASLLFGDDETMDEKRTEEMLDGLVKSAREGNITAQRIASTENIDPDVDFYMVGIKPNASRIAVKFIYRKKFGEILQNIALHQSDMQITEKINPIPLWMLKKQLISPKSNSNNNTVDPALLAKIFEAIIYGTNYPSFLLATLVRRVKTDSDIDRISNEIRVGAIKACINRKSRLSGKKEEIKLSLDTQNKNQAYLCGRLFAALEKLQQEASGNSLNRTIRDAYFSSASSKPAIIFPKLINLAQNHLKKVDRPVYFNKLIQEIVDNINGEFPEMLPLAEQGKFIIGYYQQYQSFFVKDADKNNTNQEEN